MSIIYLFLIIFFLSLAMGLIFNRNISKTIFLSMIFIILWIYMFGLLKNVKLGCITLVILGVIAMIYDITNYKKIKPLISFSALTYLILTFLISIIFFRYAHLSSWDEFTHWGTYVKNIWYFNSLGNDRFTSIANSYPPGISIFQYFLIFLNGRFSESQLYIALYILLTSIFINLTDKLKLRNNFTKFITVFFICLIFPAGFTAANSIQNIYVDTMLGILFAYCIFSLVKEEISIFGIINLSLSTALLILTKDSGLVFAFAVYCIILFDILFFRREMYKDFYINRIKNSRKLKIILCICILLPIIIKILWMIYVSINIHVSTTMNSVVFKYPTYGNSVIRAFLGTIFTNGLETTGGIIFIPTIYWIVISIFLTYITKKEKNYKIIVFSIISSTILYLLFLMMSYLFIFGEDEAMRMASVGRYLITLILGTMGIPIYYALYQFVSDEINNKIVFSVIILLVIFITGYYQFVNKLLTFNQNTTSEFYSNYNDIIELQRKLEKNTKIYYISVDSDGLDFYITKYLMTPVFVQEKNFNLYNYNDKGRIKSKDFQKVLTENKYDYVYINTVNEKLKKDYKDIFNDDIYEKSLYRVEKGGQLTKINNKDIK